MRHFHVSAACSHRSQHAPRTAAPRQRSPCPCLLPDSCGPQVIDGAGIVHEGSGAVMTAYSAVRTASGDVPAPPPRSAEE
eukprot:5521852-Prymnesium_polylepis.2